MTLRTIYRRGLWVTGPFSVGSLSVRLTARVENVGTPDRGVIYKGSSVENPSLCCRRQIYEIIGSHGGVQEKPSSDSYLKFIYLFYSRLRR